jgi:signal transduction histidine kinase
VHALLDECLAFAQAKCETPGVEVLRVYDPACPDALLDSRELRKAFLNLVLNGMEALTSGGRLTVTTVYNAETRTVTIAIEDTGAGMSEETLSRMFDLFFTTKPQGTGLGMALARSVVDLHAGELTINSTVGKGTRVAVRLPIEPALVGADGARP